jgi:hypothetical protein
MADDDLHQEIQLLRKQLDALKNEREAQASATGSDEDGNAGEEKEPDAAVEDVDKIQQETEERSDQDLASQFKGLLDSLDKDIKDTKPTTLLIVFALGVLVGRL